MYEAPYLGSEGGRQAYTGSQAINSIIMYGIAPKQDAFKLKIAPHKQKSIVEKKWQEDWPPGQRGPVLKHS